MEKLMPEKKSGAWGETLRTVVYAVLIAVGVRTFAYEPFNIPSGSMIPTLLIGDYLFVSKFSYGYSRYSFPFGLAPFQGRVFEEMPERGDVAVFKLPTDNETDYIKRIIGMPGDEIQVRAGRLYINGELVERSEVQQITTTGFGGLPETFTEYRETLPNGRTHLIWERSDNEFMDNTGVYKVPDNHFFAMGDNRDRSQDSRSTSQVGFVPLENLVGRASIIFFSTNGEAAWWQIWKWPVAIRFGRIGDVVE